MSERQTPDLAERQRELAGIVTSQPAMIEPATYERIRAQTWAIAGRQSKRNTEPTDVFVIPVVGLITPRSSWMSDIGWAVALSELRHTIEMAVFDDRVKAVVLDIDSPGGLVDGVRETAAFLRDMRQRKPIVAVANSLAASAAYYLAAQASAVYATPSGEIGSIGVLLMHVDMTRALDAEGLDVTLFARGEGKGEMSGVVPLTDAARKHTQGRIDEMYRAFLEDVALGRGGGLSPREVEERFSGGRVVSARTALRMGMVDQIRTLDNAVAMALRGDPTGFRYEHEMLELKQHTPRAPRVDVSRIGRRAQSTRPPAGARHPLVGGRVARTGSGR